MDSTIGAKESSVVDLSAYSPDYCSSIRINQENLPYRNNLFPAAYKYENIEEWYGKNVDTLIYFSLTPDSRGDIDWNSIDKKNLHHLDNMQHLYNTKLMLAISGKSDNFISLIENESKRKALTKEALDFCLQYNFSGIDFDWEYPRNDSELSLLALLIEDLKSEFAPFHLLVSAAVSRFKPLNEKVLTDLDRIHLMAYDNYGRHSTYESAIEACEYLEIKYNVNPNKIFLGIPFYGRIYSGLDPQYWTRTKTYSELSRNFTLKSSEDEAGGFYFNGIDTVKKKTAYAKSIGLGGVMIWELGQDSIGENSLLKAIREEIK